MSEVMKTAWEWFMNYGLPIVIIVVVAIILFLVVRKIIPKILEGSIHISRKDKRAREHIARRTRTLSNILVNVVGIVIAIIALAMVLDKLNIPIAPLLTGAGIVGIAVGLGAQSLIKDLISGIFILVEDQYNYGDEVAVAGVRGEVIEVGFRRTVLRDSSGTVHNIPNSAIVLTSNYTRGVARINLDLPVDYGTDLDHAMSVINRVGEEMAQEKHFKKRILSPPRALRVNNFADSGIEIRVTGDTAPGSQWEVTGEFRKRIKKAFEMEGIEIPWPHIKLHIAEGLSQACNSCHLPMPVGAAFCPKCGLPTSGIAPIDM
ncbi:MAG: mechanosensitive ion channel [Dehalococcoidia bacterium]|nr:mechanosensitive ion channel [Dehalococcoidia bacterium]